MERLLFLDAQDYGDHLPELRREAVRAVAFPEGALLLVESAEGLLKLPGGGLEPGEDDLQALGREVLEETGRRVLAGSVRPLGSIEEKRLSRREAAVWHQHSRLYLCAVSPGAEPCRYSESERRQGLRPCVCPLDEAVGRQRRALEALGRPPLWDREYRTLLLLRERLGL